MFLREYLAFSRADQATSFDFAESTYGNGDTRGVLVAYDSQYGSTSEVADFIGRVIHEDGVTVDVSKLDDVVDLASYDRVVIGGAIHYDRWMSGATKFVERNQQTLSGVPVAFFFTCLVLSKQTERAERKAEGYAAKLHELVPGVRPVSVGRFAGVLDYSRMSVVTRLLIRGPFAIIGVKEGDYRDWEAIRSWSKSLLPLSP